MRYIITQHYTVDHQSMFDLTNPINKVYADKNGFEYIVNNIKRCPERKVWWEKIAWLMELTTTVEEGALIVYEDCDAINLKGDLKTALHNGFEYGMVQLRGGLNGAELRNWYNAGVIMFLNTVDVRDYFKRVWNRNDDTDETSMNKEISFLKNTIGNSKTVCSLGIEWNCWNNNSHLTDEACIKSWHGMQYEDKLVAIKNYIATIK